MRNLRIRALRKLAQRVGLLTFVLTSTGALFGQGTLVLASGTTAGGTVALDLTLTSPTGGEPAGIQWDLTYSATDVVSINAVAAGTAVSAGKWISCSPGTHRCLLAGLNANLIQNGAVAVVTVTLATGVASTTIGVANTLGATLDGHALSVSGTGGTVTAPALTTLTGLSCTPATLSSGGTSSCTVTLSKTGGGTVTLSSNTAALTVPGSVAVVARSTTAMFTATAGGATAPDQTATLTATLNGNAQAASIILATAVKVSSVLCTPATLGSGGTSSCTVTLSKISGGTVTLSSNTAALTVPGSVAVVARSTTATFMATAGTIASDQMATLT